MPDKTYFMFITDLETFYELIMKGESLFFYISE